MFQRSFPRKQFRRGSGQGTNRNHRSFNGQGKVKIHASTYVHKAKSQEIATDVVIINKFEDFQIDQRLKENILAHGYTIPTPIQDQAIPHILNGKDVIGIANTGTGKTAAFLVPLINKIILNKLERVLIIVPTRELAIQINDELRVFTKRLNIYGTLIIGGVNAMHQISELRRNPNFVIGTPGRLKDLINRRVINLSLFKNIVLDEVDRMVDIGFIKDIKYIIGYLPKERQSLFFSATVSKETSSIVNDFLKDPVTVSVKVTENVGNIEQDIIRVNKNDKLRKLQEMLKQSEFKKVLIFGRTKWGVEKLSRSLQENGFLVASIHGNKSQNQRLRAITQFRQNELQALIATDVVARGMDICDVSHVINFDEPNTEIDYIHRIGRTGRAQKLGKALTFVE